MADCDCRNVPEAGRCHTCGNTTYDPLGYCSEACYEEYQEVCEVIAAENEENFYLKLWQI